MGCQRKVITLVILASLLNVALSQTGVVVGKDIYNLREICGYGEKRNIIVYLVLGVKNILLLFIKIAETMFRDISANTVFGP
ncbi:uncharacterized protein LOC17885358 [Capsella rubella]|uniref:uncharacterized protein LOC17885358 n=1 Tax=Capsella rubella TaxID=81985 RepID=UPI000CD4D8D9|nr:uncharacterized protein LOC17885358 [Capsella rubella]